jgi:hypothetical protein
MDVSASSDAVGIMDSGRELSDGEALSTAPSAFRTLPTFSEVRGVT